MSESLFSKFSFTFVRLETETNRLLESVYEQAMHADLSLLEWIQREYLSHKQNKIVELLDAFRV